MLKDEVIKLKKKKDVVNNLDQINSRRSEILSKQSHITSQKREVDNKISNLTNKITHTKLLVGKIDSELNDIIEKTSTNSNKQENLSVNLEYLQKQKKIWKN